MFEFLSLSSFLTSAYIPEVTGSSLLAVTFALSEALYLSPVCQDLCWACGHGPCPVVSLGVQWGKLSLFHVRV